MTCMYQKKEKSYSYHNFPHISKLKYLVRLVNRVTIAVPTLGGCRRVIVASVSRLRKFQ